MSVRTKTTARLVAALVVLAASSTVYAQHSGDIGVGRTSGGRLRTKPFDPVGTPCFDPSDDEGLLTWYASSSTWRSDTPGFDANFEADPAQDYYPLDYGAEIRLLAASDTVAPLYLTYQSRIIRHADDYITLGASDLHRHPIYVVSTTDPAFEPLRTLWYGIFILRDVGSTHYTDSEPFTIRMAIVECLPGDVNGDEAINGYDIDPFVDVLINPADATAEQRCAADANRDGIVNGYDIDAFVSLLTGS
jgi:hypothetical protein